MSEFRRGKTNDLRPWRSPLFKFKLLDTLNAMMALINVVGTDMLDLVKLDADIMARNYGAVETDIQALIDSVPDAKVAGENLLRVLGIIS